MTKNQKIIIIGAGIAGLAAAEKLQSEGLTVTILEARNRIGGRIWTDNSLGVPLDLGAAWIHGIKKNPISDLAKQFGVKTIATDYESLELYDIDGDELSNKQYKKLDKLYENVISALEKSKKSAGRNSSMADAITEFLADYDLDDTMRRGLNWTIASEFVFDLAGDLSDLSLQYWDEDEEFKGDDVIFPGGYHQIVAGLAQGLDIRLGHTVKRINYNRRGVEIETTHGIFEADLAIITLPLGVLKAEKVLFSPDLPADKWDSIHRLAMGTMNKVVLKFPKRFWPKAPHYMGYLKDINLSNIESMDYFNMYTYLKEPILVGLTAGSYAHTLEQMSNDAILDRAMSDLQGMFGSNIPNPIDMTVTKWASDPFACGSYSHIPPGASLADYDIIAEPVEDRLFFAGEGTMGDYLGTVHGAYLSGVREAKRIIDLY